MAPVGAIVLLDRSLTIRMVWAALSATAHAFAVGVAGAMVSAAGARCEPSRMVSAFLVDALAEFVRRVVVSAVEDAAWFLGRPSDAAVGHCGVVGEEPANSS